MFNKCEAGRENSEVKRYQNSQILISLNIRGLERPRTREVKPLMGVRLINVIPMGNLLFEELTQPRTIYRNIYIAL